MVSPKPYYILFTSVLVVVALPLLLFQAQTFAIISMKQINNPDHKIPGYIPARNPSPKPPHGVTTTFLGELSLDDLTDTHSEEWAREFLTPK